jgi:YafQ family addiction module toxin component
MFDYNLTDQLQSIISRLKKKDPCLVSKLRKKILEIINNDVKSINRYKNLKNVMKNRKRVHIGKSFVLVFKVELEDNFILFLDFDHHDKIYNK